MRDLTCSSKQSSLGHNDLVPAINGMTYVAAFRTYTWDEGARELSRRFFRATRSARQVVLADETRGPLGIENAGIVSHTSDLAHLGLLNHPSDNPLWFNVDYGAYVLRRALPGYDHYLLSESDLAVNLNLEPMMDIVSTRQIDVVIHDVRPSTPDWYWHRGGAAIFAQPWRSLLFFMVLSARAIDLLFETRRRQAADFQARRLAEWPFCEAFVPSVLKQAKLRFAEVGDFADIADLRFRPRIALNDERASRPGTLVHSVLAVPSYLRAVVAESKPADWFTLASDLRQALSRQSPAAFAPLLRAAFATTPDHAGLAEFNRQMASHDIDHDDEPAPADLAYCKPSVASSTSQWSRAEDPQQDAAGANGTILHADYGFHTGEETNPWWLVDLLHSYVIDRLCIVNRARHQERFTSFMVHSSTDGHVWLLRHMKLDMSAVSDRADEPHQVSFADPFVARLVRLTKLGTGVLHLRRVQVFGRSIGPGTT